MLKRQVVVQVECHLVVEEALTTDEGRRSLRQGRDKKSGETERGRVHTGIV